MPDVNAVTPMTSNAVDRLLLEAVDARQGATASVWGNPTCPTCVCAADE